MALVSSIDEEEGDAEAVVVFVVVEGISVVGSMLVVAFASKAVVVVMLGATNSAAVTTWAIEACFEKKRGRVVKGMVLSGMVMNNDNVCSTHYIRHDRHQHHCHHHHHHHYHNNFYYH